MVELLDRVALRNSRDILAALPELPVEPFSTRDLAVRLRCSTRLAQRTLYCLRTIGIVEPAGKRGHAPLHVLTTDGVGRDRRSPRWRRELRRHRSHSLS